MFQKCYVPDKWRLNCAYAVCWRVGKSDPESDAPVLLVACRDASAVENDGVFEYCESESGSSGRPGASFVDTVETLEYAWQMLFRYSAAVVGDLSVTCPGIDCVSLMVISVPPE